MSLEGQQIHRYRILSLLGSGGMGEVYLAEDARIEQQVAIKVIRAQVSPYPDAQATQEAARLFQREARAIVKLDHPHILPLYDYGEERIGNQTVVYLVMPYRREGSVADWLLQRGQQGLLSPQEVAHIVGQAASALQHAHDRQIIHQDVKPSNFLLRQRSQTLTRSDLPDLFLADFGIARLSTATASASQSIRGTPTSMAPEQWEGHPVSATDQYALAVMAYELLTGRPPFQGAPGPLMYQHLTVPPPPPSTFNARLSRDIDTVLLHALAKKPEERFASVTAFSNAFQQAVQSMQETQAPAPMTAAPTSPAPGDIRAVLAISTAEAEAGTTRMLTLPGGRKVTVPVPAGTRDGQVVRLEGQGEGSLASGEAGALILTIQIAAAEEPPSLSTASATMTEATLLTADPTALATSAPTVSDTGQQPMVSTPTRTELVPTEAATSANHASFPAPELTLPTKPSVERVDEMTSLKQTEQGAEVVPADQASQTPAMVQPQQRGLSRRTVVVGLAGLAVVGVAGSGLLWLTRSQQPAAPPTSLSSPTSLPVGTTLYTYRGHSNPVTAVAWSPDGRRIASGSYDQTVQVWDAANGGHVYIYRGQSDQVTAVAWSPDGRRIASGGGPPYRGKGNYTVQVWDAVDGGHVYTYRVPSFGVTAVAWSPDGTRIASALVTTTSLNTVQVWDAANGGHVYIYRGHSAYVNAVAWSPDGTRIASASGDETVQVWDATNGGHVYTYRGHSNGGKYNQVNAVAWSPDGKRIASASGSFGISGTDNNVQVWDAANGSHVYTYRGHSYDVFAVAWSPDGTRIASGSYDSTVQVWDAANGGHVYTYRGHSDQVNTVAWSPDGKRIASASGDFLKSNDNTVQVWIAG